MPSERRFSAVSSSPMSTLPLELLQAIPTSFSWYVSALNGVKTFSIVNDFLFVPGPPSYDFGMSEGNEAKLITSADGTPTEHTILYALHFAPWIHSHLVDNMCYGLGSRPFVVHGGCSIPLMHFQCQNPKYLHIFFHGNACDVGSSVEFLSTLSVLHGIETISVEYPGYGLHAGEPSELAVKRTAERALQYILSVAHLDTLERLLIGGQSVGTGVAVHAVRVLVNACREVLSTSGRPSNVFPPWMKLGGVLLKSPFASVKEVIHFDDTIGPDELNYWDDRLANSLDEVVPLSALVPVLPQPPRVHTTPKERSGLLGKVVQHGVHTVSNRFNSYEALLDLHTSCGYFGSSTCWNMSRKNGMLGMSSVVVSPSTPLLLLHGNRDTVIPHRHSLRLLSAFTSPMPKPMIQLCGDANSTTTVTGWSDMADVSISILKWQGHNDIRSNPQTTSWFAAIEDSAPLPSLPIEGLPDDVSLIVNGLGQPQRAQQAQPRNMPSRYMPDRFGLPVKEARALYHRHNTIVLYSQRLVAILVVLYGLALLVGSALYVVAVYDIADTTSSLINTTTIHQDTIRAAVVEPSVLAWYLGEGVAFIMGGILHIHSTRFGMGVLPSRQVPATKGQVVLYLIFRVVVYTFVLSIGLLMGPILLWDTVDWDVGHIRYKVLVEVRSVYTGPIEIGRLSEISLLDLPRLLMFISFTLHAIHLLWTVLRNR